MSRGGRIPCLVHHFNGEGLIEVTSEKENGSSRTYRLNQYGALRGAFETESDGSEDLLYDRDCGIGKKRLDDIETECTSLVTCLEETVTDEEALRYFL